MNNWNKHQLNRTLFDIPNDPTPTVATTTFPSSDRHFLPLEKLGQKPLEWLSTTSIGLYFDQRLAHKGFDKGRRLFMCDFVKIIRCHKNGNNVYIIGLCSAEMKTSQDYEVKIQIDYVLREVIWAQCQCPAGIGPLAACKHVSATLHGVEHYVVTGSRF